MDSRAANEQRQEARWRVFLMFVIMALLIIRTGLIPRGIHALVSVRQDAKLPANPTPSPPPRADLHQATLVLLCLAEAAGRLCIASAHGVWELMNQPPLRPRQKRHCHDCASLCERPAQRLDTS